MTTFTPTEDKYKTRIVYFEDSHSEKIPGYTTSQSVQKMQGDIIDLMHRMGAELVAFSRPGTFQGKPARDGYEVAFKFGKMAGRIACAALPIRGTATDHKKQQALKQALYLLRDQLRATLYTSINKPAGDMLIPYLLDSSGRTITESLIDMGSIPMLPPPALMLGSGK